MARRLNRLVSFVLTAALIVCSIGFDAQLAAAQTFTGRVAPVSAVPQVGMGIASPMPAMAPPVLALSALTAPSVLSAAPVLSAPAALTPAASIAAKISAAAPALEAIANSETGGSAAATAGRDLEDILTGAQSAMADEMWEAAFVAPSAFASPLSAASAPSEGRKSDVPSAAPTVDAPKTVESASSYSFHRLALKTIAAVTGAVFSLPQAGAALTNKIIASAADKQLVVSDFDDTLAAYNAVLPQEKIDAIRAIRKAGKHFAVVSDRGDVKRAGSTQLTVFESLANLPADVTEGMYVAANSGGKLYQYQNGVPVKIWEAEPLEAEKLQAVKDASAATVARLSEVGVEPHPGDSVNPKESFNTYGYALMIKVGATPVQMTQVAAIMSQELAKRGIEVEVSGRLPKDLKNPGYAMFSIITKAPATAKIAEKLGLKSSQALVIGDMMYVPRPAKKASWMTRLGLKLSGLAIGETGNETDRNMSKGLPGVLALGVGRKMDPRIPNGWNLAGHGPDVTQKVLESVASKAARAGLNRAQAPNDLYAPALAKIIAKAAESGVPADKIKFLSAVHEARSINGARVGDEWRFFFGWGNENGGLSYKVTARGTTVAETALEPELVGTVSAEHLSSGVDASNFDTRVKLGPNAALAAFDGVTRVSLLPRADAAGDYDLWYSLQDSRDELAAVNARTGEVRKGVAPAPAGSTVKAFFSWLALAGLVAAIYGAFYWAASHAPAAVPQILPEGYNGPIPSIDEMFNGMGGVLGLGALAGMIRSKKAKLTDDDVRAAASGAIASKGRPWSETEYNMGYYYALESLKSRGATAAQIALFAKLCAEAPIKGGSFNPWSGD